MTWVYGKGSRQKLATCCPELQDIANDALIVSPYDISIIHGWRGEAEQNALYDSNASEKMWPYSMHNNMTGVRPYSLAIDFAPWVNGINWEDTHIFAVIAGCFFVAAIDRGYTIRWGGDFNGNGSTKDQRLKDWGHIEIIL